MRYEWKKLGCPAILLLLAVVLVNAWLFYDHCTDSSTGYTLMQVKEKFDWPVDALETQLAALEDRIFAMTSKETDLDDDLVTGNLFSERELNKAVLARRKFDYGNYLKEIQADADIRLHSGLFGSENSFSVRSMRRTKEIYGALEPLQAQPAFSGALEVFGGWYLSDILFLLFGFAPSLFLLTQERRSGLLALLRPTKRGHGALYLQKFAVMTAAVLLGFFLIYGADLAISAQLFGFGDLSRPIQSAYGFQGCPLPLTVLGYLVCFFGTKLLWGLAVSTLFFAICAIVPRISAVLLCTAAILAAALGMGVSGSLWLRTFSLSDLAQTEQMYQQCPFLDFFGTPIWQVPVGLGFCALLIVLGFLAGLLAFVRINPTVTAKQNGIPGLRLLNRHTSLFLHEGQKLLGMNGAGVLLIVLVAVQCFSYCSFDAPDSVWDYYYRQYSACLSGAPNASSDRFLADEKARFEEIHQKISSYYETAGADAAELLTAQLQDELRAEEAFSEAAAQYEALREGQSYIDRTGYERLCGCLGQRDDLLNTIKWFLFLVLAFSSVFAVERETGMEILQATAGAKRRIAWRKCVLCGIVLFVSFWIAYLPQYLAVLKHFGLPEQGAVANSLALFSGFSDGWSILGVLLLMGLLRLLLGAAATALILTFSRKTGNKITTILLGFGVLILPTIILRLLL